MNKSDLKQTGNFLLGKHRTVHTEHARLKKPLHDLHKGSEKSSVSLSCWNIKWCKLNGYRVHILNFFGVQKLKKQPPPDHYLNNDNYACLGIQWYLGPSPPPLALWGETKKSTDTPWLEPVRWFITLHIIWLSLFHFLGMKAFKLLWCKTTTPWGHSHLSMYVKFPGLAYITLHEKQANSLVSQPVLVQASWKYMTYPLKVL